MMDRVGFCGRLYDLGPGIFGRKAMHREQFANHAGVAQDFCHDMGENGCVESSVRHFEVPAFVIVQAFFY